jgi:hypothetical protein
MNEVLLEFLRNTIYLVQSVLAVVAPDDIPNDVAGSDIQLNGLYDGFTAGRWVIVAGERTDITDDNKLPLPGIWAAELRTINGTRFEPDPKSPGDTRHTTIELDSPLAFSYKRTSVTIYGNVVEASHGETVPNEVLGSGNSAATLQQFQLKRPPLTYVPATSTSGAQGTETIRVNNVRYHRVESLLDAADNDRAYELAEDENGVSTVTFGGRLPTGQENVRASYRVGIGSPGNVDAGQISLLTSKPSGVQAVTNPLKSTGGADRDAAERIRRNLPLSTQTMGPHARLVSVSDYASFALRFAGIGHAYAQKLYGDLVLVTVCGVDDIPLTDGSQLVVALRNAYREFGDPALRVVVVPRELQAIILQADIVIDSDFELDPMQELIRARLLDEFSFDRSQLAESQFLSRAVSAIQNIRGVDWVDINIFDAIPESVLLNAEALKEAVSDLSRGARSAIECAAGGFSRDDQQRANLWGKVNGDVPRFLPAQLAYLTPAVRSALALNLAWERGKR